jgi:hypothetical protein
MTREEYINILEIEKAELTKENQELRKLKTYFIADTGEKLEYTLDDYMTILDINIQQNEQICELKKQVEELNRFKFSCKKDETQMPATIYNKKTVEDISKIKSQQKEFIKYLEDEIYNIEPKGTSINYNCEYDSEEDYINAMEEQSELITLKNILQKYKEIIGDDK